MEAIATFGSRRLSGSLGSLISVAVVLSCASGRADEIVGFADSSGTGLIGNFSRSDLAELEYASTAEATAARLAAFETTGRATLEAQPRLASSGDAGTFEAFPHSGRVMPLLTTFPAAGTPVSRAILAVRPGQARPVGVSPTTLRSPTPAERAAR